MTGYFSSLMRMTGITFGQTRQPVGPEGAGASAARPIHVEETIFAAPPAPRSKQRSISPTAPGIPPGETTAPGHVARVTGEPPAPRETTAPGHVTHVAGEPTAARPVETTETIQTIETTGTTGTTPAPSPPGTERIVIEGPGSFEKSVTVEIQPGSSENKNAPGTVRKTVPVEDNQPVPVPSLPRQEVAGHEPLHEPFHEQLTVVEAAGGEREPGEPGQVEEKERRGITLKEVRQWVAGSASTASTAGADAVEAAAYAAPVRSVEVSAPGVNPAPVHENREFSLSIGTINVTLEDPSPGAGSQREHTPMAPAAKQSRGRQRSARKTASPGSRLGRHYIRLRG